MGLGVLLHLDGAAAGPGGVGVEVEGAGDIGDECCVVVVADVILEGGELRPELWCGFDGGLFLGVVAVGGGEDVVEWLEVELDLGEVVGDEVDLAQEGAHGGDVGGERLVDDWVQVGGRAGDVPM